MKYHHFIKKHIIFIFLGVAFLGFSQEKYKVADGFFDKNQFNKAAKTYEVAFNKGDNSRELLQKAGNAYYFNGDMKSANKWYGKLMGIYKKGVSTDYFFRYAQSFNGIQKYAAAKKWMKEYLKRDKLTIDEVSGKEINITELLEKEQEFELNNLSINTAFSDFGPVFYGDKLVYASAKDSSYFKTSKYNLNQPPFLNLYIGSVNSKERDVIMIEEFSEVINSKFHEATLVFTADFKKVYYTRNNFNGNSGSVDSEGVNRLKLYSAIAFEGENGKIDWKNSKELPFNSDEYSVGHPALNKNETKLYFVSDMPGTIGETDIFVVDILDDDTYSQPENLGTKINTKGKEMFPFVTSNKLYFASDGHLGLGGLDVFESEFNLGFETPKNLGAPLNSILDDFGYIVNEENNTGFMCSNRNTGKGDDDIYFFERTPPGSCKQHIKGYISNSKTGERLANALVVLYNNNGKKIEETITEINGAYVFKSELNCNTKYVINVEKKGYFNTEKLTLTDIKRGVTIVPIGLDVISELIVEENGVMKIKIGIIYFDLDKYDIRKDAALEFDKVVSLMKKYPKMVINIESHTDSRASDKYNLTLSDNRAKATRDYIISRGINHIRISSAKGYGETQLINKCENGVQCSDALHQLNRRSEFIILKM